MKVAYLPDPAESLTEERGKAARRKGIDQPLWRIEISDRQPPTAKSLKEKHIIARGTAGTRNIRGTLADT